MQILIFGDSITQGFHDDEKAGWVSRLFAHCIGESVRSNHEKYISIFNFGVSGDRSCDVIKRFDAEFTARNDSQETVTIFALGTNDYAKIISSNTHWCSLDDFKENMTAMIGKAQQRGKVALVGLTAMQEALVNPTPWLEDFAYCQADRDTYDEAVKDLANTHNCLYIETNDLFLPNKEAFLTDGLHPNAEGHRLIYERVKSELEKAGIL